MALSFNDIGISKSGAAILEKFLDAETVKDGIDPPLFNEICPDEKMLGLRIRLTQINEGKFVTPFGPETEQESLSKLNLPQDCVQLLLSFGIDKYSIFGLSNSDISTIFPTQIIYRAKVLQIRNRANQTSLSVPSASGVAAAALPGSLVGVAPLSLQSTGGTSVLPKVVSTADSTATVKTETVPVGGQEDSDDGHSHSVRKAPKRRSKVASTTDANATVKSECDPIGGQKDSGDGNSHSVRKPLKRRPKVGSTTDVNAAVKSDCVPVGGQKDSGDGNNHSVRKALKRGSDVGSSHKGKTVTNSRRTVSKSDSSRSSRTQRKHKVESADSIKQEEVDRSGKVSEGEDDDSPLLDRAAKTKKDQNGQRSVAFADQDFTVYCCIHQCLTREKSSATVTFHKLPDGERERKRWVTFIRGCNGPNFPILGHEKLCSKHFPESCFSSVGVLKTPSIPSLVPKPPSKIWSKISPDAKSNGRKAKSTATIRNTSAKFVVNSQKRASAVYKNTLSVQTKLARIAAEAGINSVFRTEAKGEVRTYETTSEELAEVWKNVHDETIVLAKPTND